MGRAILAVVAGYAVMFLFVFSTFTVAYMVLGPERAFTPGTYEVSATWVAVSIALGLAAAVVGGFVCAAIAKSSRPPIILAVLVVGLGLVLAVPALAVDRGTAKQRSPDTGNLAAMSNAEQPAWIALLNPFLGAIGVWIGAALKRRDP